VSDVLEVRGLAAHDVTAIAGWRYAGGDAIYDPGQDAVVPDRGYVGLFTREAGELVGYGCSGDEARVPGLDAEPGTVDVGVGLRPGLVGGGWGAAVVAALLEHLGTTSAAGRFRVAVLDGNERSLRTFLRAGFVEHDEVVTDDGRRFVTLVRAPSG
jgi:[ribosomal protein S18]-alanine N-acetyltransferase